ncbi:MAG: tetratricopeptide repeat protein [Planctomycetia bacterium]|nr:MAG: tetratricopeptide repeat protein [Planctomycetota bacterium]KAB2947637.1 MAG: tetratricopeptide repeat protein [Phycisphaerae bacterium]MBE7455743.1 tetratricopeptide repeat protein [Planctomycetia bacterium]MCK6463379.1 tetratricopeptide repeat protein [Phycisphaerae bacterium]MCQ3919495.1 hypothetical protein [Planctomycetota bacterium]
MKKSLRGSASPGGVPPPKRATTGVSREGVRDMMQRAVRVGAGVMMAASLIPLAGCQYPYRSMRIDGQQAVLAGQYGQAREIFMSCHDRRPGDAENLHDVGAMSFLLAQQRFTERNAPAGLRECDRAIDFYGRAITARPNYPAALIGRNSAFELKGQFEKALEQAEWASRYVGPMAKQYIFLAREHEERGDLDLARLRYRQAVVLEPESPEAHQAYGEFLRRRNLQDEASVELREAERLYAARKLPTPAALREAQSETGGTPEPQPDPPQP